MSIIKYKNKVWSVYHGKISESTYIGSSKAKEDADMMADIFDKVSETQFKELMYGRN